MDDEYAVFDEDERLTLFEVLDPKEAARQGGLKTYQVKDEGGLVYDAGRKTDYSITVERLLSVDGWEMTLDDGKVQKQAMTLLIFKMGVNCTSKNGRVKSIKATVEFDNQRAGERANPEVEAWAPFRDLQLTNATKVQTKSSTKTDVRAGLAKEGVTLSAGWSKGLEISFERTYFDRAFAYPEMNEETGKRGGVTWSMEQNEVQNNGVLPVVFTAVLLKKASATAPYVVKFRIRVHGGSIYDLKNNLKKTFGLGPGVTRPYLVWPTAEPKVRYEGEQFLACVKPGHLGSLKAKDALNGLTIIGGASTAKTAEKPGEKQTAEEGDGGKGDGGGGKEDNGPGGQAENLAGGDGAGDGDEDSSGGDGCDVLNE